MGAEVLLLIPVTIYLAVGCLAFLVCISNPRLRGIALDSGLWFALCGILSPVTAIVTVMAVAWWGMPSLDDIAQRDAFLVDHFGLIVLANLLALAILATFITLAHRRLLRKMTFSFFRIYISGIAGAVGLLTAILVTTWCLFASIGSISFSAFVGLALCTTLGLGYIAFKWAATFRALQPLCVASDFPENV
ncbi:MAG TPA: hypothetical protein VGN16_07895 [Acidobacteriaceae bacterium]